MQNSVHLSKGYSWHHLLLAAGAVILLNILGAASVVVPSSSCYALDNSSHIVDFTDWVGHPFEYEGKDSDLVVRFCKDVESRSQTGYIDFGRFDALNYFVAGSGDVNFVQGFYKGDLLNCEKSYDKMGRTAQVNIICGNCRSSQCKGSFGCICNVTYESSCRAIVELAIPCKKQGPRVFEGFTVGFHPRSSEVVHNGMTQLGFEKSHHDFSFSSEQTHLTLYITAVASLSQLVQKPTVKIFPEKGLDLQLSGSAMTGRAPTTLSPSTLVMDWKCVVARNMPYEVEISIPIKKYEVVQFTLTKMCEYKQNKEKETTKGWAIFGVISFVFTLCFALFCCGGFLYRTKYQNQHGLDALPGITTLSACLQTVTGVQNSYHRSESDNRNDPFLDESSWGNQPTNSQVPSRRTEAKYGSI